MKLWLELTSCSSKLPHQSAILLVLDVPHLHMPFFSMKSYGMEGSWQKCWNKYDTIWTIEKDVSSHMKNYVVGLFQNLKNYILKKQVTKNITVSLMIVEI